MTAHYIIPYEQPWDIRVHGLLGGRGYQKKRSEKYHKERAKAKKIAKASKRRNRQ